MQIADKLFNIVTALFLLQVTAISATELSETSAASTQKEASQSEKNAVEKIAKKAELSAIEKAHAVYKAEEYEAAYQLYLPLAIAGNAEAQAKIGIMNFWGRGTKKDEFEAYSWSLKAAKQDNPLAQHMLGYLYENGIYVGKDERIALSWYRKAADQGHAPAVAIMASSYIYGNVLPKNVKLGFDLAKRAAKQDNAFAEYLIGYVYENEYNDLRQALKWYTKAAENRYAAAANQIATLYYQGKGMPAQDLKEAFLWFYIAEELGSPEGYTNRPIIEAKLDPKDVVILEQEAKRWLVKLK